MTKYKLFCYIEIITLVEELNQSNGNILSQIYQMNKV